jgi:hypothetical protein
MSKTLPPRTTTRSNILQPGRSIEQDAKSKASEKEVGFMFPEEGSA